MKNIVLLGLLCLISNLAHAQNNILKNGWQVEAGPSLNVPIRYMHYFTVFGAGIDGAINTTVVDRLHGGLRANYAYFFGKGSIEGEDINLSLVNVMADAYYLFGCNLLLGFSGGLGLTFGGGNSDANFSRIFYAGYQFPTSCHDLVVTAFFDQTNYQKNIGVRAAFVLPLHPVAGQ